MNQQEAQRALEEGQVLEGNAFRIYMADGRLVVQDLLEGWWTEHDTYALRTSRRRPAPSTAIAGKGAAVRRDPNLAAALGWWVETIGEDATTETGELAAILVSGDNQVDAEASKQIPLLPQMRSRARPFRYIRKDHDPIVRRVAVATTALARLGGSAEEEDLLALLADLGHEGKEGQEAVAAACRFGEVRMVDRFSPCRTYRIVPAISLIL